MMDLFAPTDAYRASLRALQTATLAQLELEDELQKLNDELQKLNDAKLSAAMRMIFHELQKRDKLNDELQKLNDDLQKRFIASAPWNCAQQAESPWNLGISPPPPLGPERLKVLKAEEGQRPPPLSPNKTQKTE